MKNSLMTMAKEASECALLQKKDSMFDEALGEAELFAWQSLKLVVTNFLGKPQEYEIREVNRRATKKSLPSQGTNINQTAPFK